MTSKAAVRSLECHLCGAAGPLRRSHIVPKFAFDYVKARGPLREMATPNRVVQDGPKPRFFCAVCEERFSKWESKVALGIFRPIHEQGIDRLRYGEWLLPFAVSLSFRIFTYWTGDRSNNSLGYLDDWTADERRSLEIAVERWRHFLLHGAPVAPEHHMFILPHVEASAFDARAPLSAYFRGGLDLQSPYRASDGGLYVIGKLCRLCSIGVIRGGRRRPWRNTKVHRSGGALGSPYAIAPWVLEYFRDAMSATATAVSELSDKQRARVIDAGLRSVLGVTCAR